MKLRATITPKRKLIHFEEIVSTVVHKSHVWGNAPLKMVIGAREFQMFQGEKENCVARMVPSKVRRPWYIRLFGTTDWSIELRGLILAKVTLPLDGCILVQYGDRKFKVPIGCRYFAHEDLSRQVLNSPVRHVYVAADDDSSLIIAMFFGIVCGGLLLVQHLV